jgi:cobalt-zinc-cadmium resistance protein CzcA
MHKIIAFSLRYKAAVLVFAALIAAAGVFSLSKIPIGAVPDITNNQVQVITTSRNLSTEDVEKFLTYPIELEMANLPGVKEIRSVSKFGLSVVTVIFDEDLGTYLPRQLISEKIASAKQNIPESFGTPFMGPITTGLGEIYQYTLDVKPGYEDQYSAMELRTIHDWVVRRQLAGIDGVVEVNTWGGYLKQYEVEVDPLALQSAGVTLQEVYRSLQANNLVSGGAYIEKNGVSYFIRGEGLMESAEAIESTLVRQVNGVSVTIRDVAKVQYGHAPRFGAITANGNGETVLGQVMMLKGANSNDVIQRVKERVEQVSKSLPEGVFINPFLDRSELIGRTTSTVQNNLLEGCLIVIFVVVLLLGNFRSGLVVASVIPLSLLFALTMMYIFGVDANLMSLGAIDFGIIIDGAVIIVEFVAAKMATMSKELKTAKSNERRMLKDSITLDSASKMMKSAIFGQLIILIVFIPILSMTGVEGKMFRPMALTFSFALIGAMILCLTYVPVISAMVLSDKGADGNKVSRGLIHWLDRLYQPVLRGAMRAGNLVLMIAVGLLVVTYFVFDRLGGEFVPTLDEGDFVVQPVLPAGTSLSETVYMTTQMEQTLIEHFPEVDQIVTRIGAAEVPTDPMSMEESDVIIRLHPPDEWVNAESKAELADQMKQQLTEHLGIEMEITQPIEMRFNELITGTRADLAIKIFGEDLETLFELGSSVKSMIADVDGAADVTMEKIDGIPMLSASFDRDALAAYGLHIDEVSTYISAMIAGAEAGQLFEGERRFDVVMRLKENDGNALDAYRSLMIDLPEGGQIPLSAVATVEMKESPAKISRDDTHRRVVVGVNVRGRDLESVVQDIQQIIDARLELPAGYSIDFGGQFENLRRARQRLAIAVPIALLMIFFMLYTAFRSLKEALIIFTAIPLAAVGGVFLLALRDLPFSISAGVGFIALFGIAVLNGIVLIEHLKTLVPGDGETMREAIERGARERLRPVILTASAAALGFLPMATSVTAGAEVQRPLATVVIGGLVTSTLLTLVVLPVLYRRFIAGEQRSLHVHGAALTVLILILSMGLSHEVSAQNDARRVENRWTLENALERGVANHPAVSAAEKELQALKEAEPVRIEMPAPEVYHSFDENNIAENGEPIAVFGVTQTVPLPGSNAGARRMYTAEVSALEQQLRRAEQKVKSEIATAFMQQVIQIERLRRLSTLDSLHQVNLEGVQLQAEQGALSGVDVLRAEQAALSIRRQRMEAEMQLRTLEYRLGKLLGAASSAKVVHDGLVLTLETPEVSSLPAVQQQEALLRRAEAEITDQRSARIPQLALEGFEGTNSAPGAERYAGFRVGLSLPIWPTATKRRVTQARLNADAAKSSVEQIRLESELDLNARIERVKYLESVNTLYKEQSVPNAERLLEATLKARKEGAISLQSGLLDMERAAGIQLEYLDQCTSLNDLIISIKYHE